MPATNVTDDTNGLAADVVTRRALRAGSRSNALHPATMPIHSKPCRFGGVQRISLNEMPFSFVSEPL
jgi:hypothetical protein